MKDELTREPFERTHEDGLEEAVMEATSELSAKVMRKNGENVDLGVVSRKDVTNDFVDLIVDALQAQSSTLHNFKYHGVGISPAAENQTDSALVSEDQSTWPRNGGTQEEGGASNIYQSVLTWTAGATLSITEHGLFNAGTAGTLMDRSMFAAISVTDGDKIEFTYKLTVAAGG